MIALINALCSKSQEERHSINGFNVESVPRGDLIFDFWVLLVKLTLYIGY